MMAMQLSFMEWKMLSVWHLRTLADDLAKLDTLSMDGIQTLNDYWNNEIMARISAWATESTIATRKAQAAQTQVSAQAPAPILEQTLPSPDVIPIVANGAAPPVNKGGWPKGRKRTPKPTAPVTPPAVTM